MKKHFGNLSSPNPKMVKCDFNCRNADGQLAAASKEVPVLLPHDWVDALDQPLALRQPLFFFLNKGSFHNQTIGYIINTVFFFIINTC